MSKTEPELECSLCKDIYQEPKTLGCLHSFCLQCLETYSERNHSNQTLTCPLCRTPFQSKSQEQLANLPTDSYLSNALNTYRVLKNSISQHKDQKLMCLDEENEAICYCLDCQEYLCETCAKFHQKAKGTKNHQQIQLEDMKNEKQFNSMLNSNSQLYCQIHGQKEIELFCDDCKEPICSLCTDTHSIHKVSSLSNIIGNEKQTLIELISQVSSSFLFPFFV